MNVAVSPSLRQDLGLMLWQVRYEQRAYWRNRGRGVFTFVFPLMFLVIFGSLDKSGHITLQGHRLPYDDFFVPGILSYAVIATTYINMAIGTSVLRDQGVLKRMQGTPLPRWAYVGSRILSTAGVVFAISALTIALGVVAYDVHLRGSTLPGLLLTLLLGTAAFTTLGIGITRFIPNAEAAPVVVNLTILPLTFVSGVWFPTSGMPKWLKDIANFFPIHPLSHGLQYAFNPFTSGAGLSGPDLRTLGIWTVAGIFLMLRFLRKPSGDLG